MKRFDDIADGPFDADAIDAAELDFSDFAVSVLDLGSLRIPLPEGAEVQVEMGPSGPKLLHVITPYGRITPVGFAAPRGSGLWNDMSQDVIDTMRSDGMRVRLEEGPWNMEVIGAADAATLRVIGVDGARWMVRFSCTSPNEYVDELNELAHQMLSRTIVHRGEEPLPAGSTLPIAVPTAIAEQIQSAMTGTTPSAAIPPEPSPPVSAVETPTVTDTPSATEDTSAVVVDHAPTVPVHGMYDYTDDMTNGSAIQQMKPQNRSTESESGEGNPDAGHH